ITIADYRRYVKPNGTAADVRATKLDDAKTIYKARYWEAMRCDDLRTGLDYAAAPSRTKHCQVFSRLRSAPSPRPQLPRLSRIERIRSAYGRLWSRSSHSPPRQPRRSLAVLWAWLRARC